MNKNRGGQPRRITLNDRFSQMQQVAVLAKASSANMRLVKQMESRPSVRAALNLGGSNANTNTRGRGGMARKPAAKFAAAFNVQPAPASVKTMTVNASRGNRAQNNAFDRRPVTGTPQIQQQQQRQQQRNVPLKKAPVKLDRRPVLGTPQVALQQVAKPQKQRQQIVAAAANGGFEDVVGQSGFSAGWNTSAPVKRGRGGFVARGGRGGFVARGGREGFVARGGRGGFVARGGRGGSVARGGRGSFVPRGGRGGFVARGGRGGFVARGGRGGFAAQAGGRGGFVARGGRGGFPAGVKRGRIDKAGGSVKSRLSIRGRLSKVPQSNNAVVSRTGRGAGGNNRVQRNPNNRIQRNPTKAQRGGGGRPSGSGPWGPWA